LSDALCCRSSLVSFYLSFVPPPRPPTSPLFPYTTLFRSEPPVLAARSLCGPVDELGPGQEVDGDVLAGRDLLLEVPPPGAEPVRSEEHTSELQSPYDLVCRLLLEKKKNKQITKLQQVHLN